MEASDIINIFKYGFWKEFDWRKESDEVNEKFIDFFQRVKNQFNPEEFDTLMHFFDCFDPFCNWEELVVFRILKLIGYAHWNQYYFEHMPDIQLKGLCMHKIKDYYNKLELFRLQEDF